MALRVSRVGRNRSSTSASRGLRGDEHETRTAELVRQLQFHEDGSESEQLPQLIDCAVELRALVAEDGSSRDVFRRGKGFEAVLEILSRLPASLAHDSLQSLLRLVEQLLLLVADCLRGHRGNQRYFSQRCEGWQLMERALFAFQETFSLAGDVEESESNSLALYSSLLKLAVDDESLSLTLDGPQVEDEDGQATSVNGTFDHPQAAKVAVRLALKAPSANDGDYGVKLFAVAVRVLQRVRALARSSTRNAFAIWQAGVLSDVLPFALDEKVSEELKRAAHDLTLGLADFGLGTLDDVARLFRKARTSDEARDLLLAILRRSKGPSYVQFDMRRSGHSSIELPSLPRAFPPTSGYTLTAWLRIDEYDPNCHTTLFGAFDASQSCFILVYLEKDSHQLILQTSIRSSKPSVRFRSTRLSAKRWYHVALVHRKATDSRQSTAVLFIDGEFTEQVKCAYPESPPTYEEKDALSSPAAAGARRSKPVEAFFGTPHGLAVNTGRDRVRSQWSLASAHLYGTPLTDEFVSVHHKLGVRYSGNFQDCLGPLLTYRASAELNRYNELLHPDKSDKSDIVTATDGRGSDVVPEARLLLNISPAAIIDLDGNGAKNSLDRKALARYQQLSQKTTKIAVNAAIPTLNEAISRSYGTGILTGEPVVVAPKALDDSSWCLAGCLPLVIGLLDSATTKGGFLQATRIYFECMEDNWRISEEMEKSQGFGMLAMIIREKLGFETSWSSNTTRKPAQLLSMEDRQTLPLELLQLILKYVGYDSSRPDNSMIVNPMGYRVLLVDFDTWRRSDIRTQKLYYEQFIHFTTHNRHQHFNTKRLIRMRVVRKLIEAMRCEEVPEGAIEPLSKALRALLDNSSAQTGYKGAYFLPGFNLLHLPCPEVQRLVW